MYHAVESAFKTKKNGTKPFQQHTAEQTQKKRL